MQVLALLCLFVVAISADLRKEFDDWKQTHNKVYKADEEQLRFRNFVASLRKIALLNSNSSGATYGLNQFSDMSPVEFKRLYKMQNGIRSNGIHPEFVKPEVSAVPQSIDWRTEGVVTPVKNQEQCGSCWAFSTTEAIESAWMIAKNLKVDNFKPLGPQQIVDCDNSDGGCNGGNPPTAYAYVISAGGQETEKAYPYTGEDGTCNFKKADVEVTISNWKYATTEEDEETLKQNVACLEVKIDAAYGGLRSSHGPCGPLSVRRFRDFEDGVGFSLHGRTFAFSLVQMGNTPSDPNTTIELAEETLSVSKRRVETGRVRVRIRTESEETQANASLFDQDVDISRVPIGRDVTEVPAVRQEGDVTIYPVLEEVLVVEKRLVLKEEVHVRRVVSQTEVSQPVTLRRQWADVERTAGNNEDQVKE